MQLWKHEVPQVLALLVSRGQLSWSGVNETRISLSHSRWISWMIDLTMIGRDSDKFKKMKKPSKLKNAEKQGKFQMWLHSVFISEKSNGNGYMEHQGSFRDCILKGLWGLQNLETQFNLEIQCCSWSAFFSDKMSECALVRWLYNESHSLISRLMICLGTIPY